MQENEACHVRVLPLAAAPYSIAMIELGRALSAQAAAAERASAAGPGAATGCGPAAVGPGQAAGGGGAEGRERQLLQEAEGVVMYHLFKVGCGAEHEGAPWLVTLPHI